MFLSPPLSIKLSSVAKRICELGEWNVSNLRLQKLLYICNMFYYGEKQSPLVQENFEAWMYGPVIPQLYQKMKIYGAQPVGDRFYNAIPLSQEEESVVDAVCGALKELSDADLVAITHSKNGAWSKCYKPGERGIVIKKEDILNEYKTKTQR